VAGLPNGISPVLLADPELVEHELRTREAGGDDDGRDPLAAAWHLHRDAWLSLDEACDRIRADRPQPGLARESIGNPGTRTECGKEDSMRWEEQPDLEWVAALAGVSERQARTAVEEARSERRLFGRIERAHRAGGRPSYIEIDAPFELYAIARLRRPRHVVEVGVSSGVSSAYLLTALERNGYGTLHSIDLPQFASRGGRRRRPDTPSWVIPDGQSSGWAVPMSLRGRWDLRLGDKRAVIPLLADDLPRVDMMVYDVPHSDRDAAREFRSLDRRLCPKGVAIADHGPGGGRCTALQAWAVRRSSSAIRCGELGLYGFRAG
jgi:hypothetical protein